MTVPEHSGQIAPNQIAARDNKIQETLNQKYYPGLDGLRAIAIIFVLIDHCTLSTRFQSYTGIGKIGVEIFFVISGFLITTLLLKEFENKGSVSLKNFYIRRALRIVPVAWLFLFVVYFLNIRFNLGLTKMAFFACIFYFLNLPIKEQTMFYIGHFWSLGVEEQFYLFFPALLLWNRNFSKWFIVILFVCIPVLAWFGFNKVGVFYSNKFVHNTTFLILAFLGTGSVSIFIGCMLSILLFEGWIKKIPGNKYLSIVVFVVAVLLRLKHSPLFIEHFSQEIFSVLIAVVILLNLNTENYFSKILNTKILVKIGIMSYSIYIWQQLFTHYQPWSHLFKYAGSLFINLPALFIVAYFSYYFYEKKFLVLKKKFV